MFAVSACSIENDAVAVSIYQSAKFRFFIRPLGLITASFCITVLLSLDELIQLCNILLW